MTKAASAATIGDSANTTETPAVTDFNGWDEHGTPIRIEPETPPAKQDSAPAEKDKAAADSAPQKDQKTADSASDSATDKDQKPHQKTKQDTDRRFREILDENKTLKSRLDALERAKPSDTRDTKPASQPAKEEYKPLDETEYFKANPKATYEDFVRTAAKHEAKWEADRRVTEAIAAERQRLAVEAASKDLSAKVAEAEKRYGKDEYQSRVKPASEGLMADHVPFAVKAVINDSPVFADLMYVLGEPEALKDLIATARTNPTAALRKVMLTEQLVQAELAKASGGTGKDDGDKSSRSSETAASQTKPRAPKPITEVGGRGSAPDDPLRTAAAAGDFRSFDTEMTRRLRASKG